MLEEAFDLLYTKFKIQFYRRILNRFESREATLTTVETFCVESILALGEPTIAEFSHFIGISTPNAAYKVASLVRKGYVEKIQSETDRREYHLRPTIRAHSYYNISREYRHSVMKRIRERFTPEECAEFSRMLDIIARELMPELQLPAEKAAQKARTAKQ